MFIKIKTVRRVNGSFHYNEEKLGKGTAECLLAENFVKDLDKLTQKDKLFHFTRLNSLNDNVHKKGLHIFLTFHPSDNLSNTDMQHIAKDYMNKMRLGDQPYLVYSHHDTVHPHLHVITTKIKHDGSTLNLYPKDYYASARITRQFEQTYALVLPGTKPDDPSLKQQPIQKLKNGHMAVMPAISRVLEKVHSQYSYTSLPEVNAILRLYNVAAYPGKEGGRLHQRHGLLYRILDDQGRPTGSPIPASHFDSKPTLRNLEQQFLLHQRDDHRGLFQQHISETIDRVFRQAIPDILSLQKVLEKENISMVLQKDKKDSLQNIFYIDHKSKAAFDARSFDKPYQAESLQYRCLLSLLRQQAEQTQQQSPIQQPVLSEQQSPAERQLPIQRRPQTQRPRLRHRNL